MLYYSTIIVTGFVHRPCNTLELFKKSPSKVEMMLERNLVPIFLPTDSQSDYQKDKREKEEEERPKQDQPVRVNKNCGWSKSDDIPLCNYYFMLGLSGGLLEDRRCSCSRRVYEVLDYIFEFAIALLGQDAPGCISCEIKTSTERNAWRKILHENVILLFYLHIILY